jgi:cytochrome P450
MRAALPAFLDRFGDYTVDPASLTWKQSNTLRGPTTMRVRRGPGLSNGQDGRCPSGP